ncbi:hypothetical protein F5Y16DRAFT_399908 [Xylariaceae sp. FL0255]|nr:hypothetical protein F5Y16DRAFT_399908 [Xylariaceae sp. FL0255]
MSFPISPQPSKGIYHRLRLSEEKMVTDPDDIIGHETLIPSQRPSRHTIITYGLITLLTISLIILSTLYLQLLRQTSYPPSSSSPPAQPLLTCGRTIAEARQANSLHNMSDWRYWTNLSLSTEITDEDMALVVERPRSETGWVSTIRMHLVHCAYGLMQRSGALDAGDRLDLATSPLDHTKHCIELLLHSAMQDPAIDAPV